MKLFIKLECENKDAAIDKLEAMAFKMPAVCIMDTHMLDNLGGAGFFEGGPITETDAARDYALDYFNRVKGLDYDPSRCVEIISNTEDMEEHDFMFEFKSDPSEEQIDRLKKLIDGLLTSIGCQYSLMEK
jgi:hypothetical protein